MSRKQYGGLPRPASESSVGDEDIGEEKVSRRAANVYDAVAGRVTQAGLTGNIKDVKASRQPLRPDEVLFKQANAPVRYEETDYYNAHAQLPANQPLPSGDLLTAIHIYVSKLFSRTSDPNSLPAWRCMDETALIAFGILMEETVREVLGDTGDFAFVEASNDDEEKHFDLQDGYGETDVESPKSREMSRGASTDVDDRSTDEDSRLSSEESN